MNQLKELRIARGLTQKELAEALGATPHTVRTWEIGLCQPPDARLISLAKVLNCTADLLDTGRYKDNPFRRYRLRAGLTRKQAALELGATREGVGCWERGADFPIEKNLRRIAEIYHCSIDDLIGEKRKKPVMTVEGRNQYYMAHKGLIQWLMESHKSVLLATGVEFDDVFQELSICMLRALDRQEPGKGNLTNYLVKTLKWELLNYATRHRAKGLSGLKRDDWRNYPAFTSIESLFEAGTEIADYQTL